MNCDIRKTLGIEIESPFWQQALEQAQALPQTPVWLTEEYLTDLERDFELLGEHSQTVFRALGLVTKSPELCLLAKVLWCIIGEKKQYGQSFSQFSLPVAPDGVDPAGYDFVGLLPILGHVRPFARELEQRGIEKDIIFDTLSFLRGFIGGCGKDRETPRFDAFRYLGVFVYTNFLWIGRLRFEIQDNARRGVWIFRNGAGQLRTLMCDVQLHSSGHIAGTVGCENEPVFDADFRETEEFYEGHEADPVTGLAVARVRLDKRQWVPVLQPGDTLLKVHIPYRGRLDREECQRSYARARQAFRTGFPEYSFKGFVCTTWLLSPALATFLKEDSNILQFQKDYSLFPAKSTGADVFQYVFKMQVKSAAEVDGTVLPEDNSMMRGVKRLHAQGTYIHEVAGFFPFEAC